jgi:hypothetical protein
MYYSVNLNDEMKLAELRGSRSYGSVLIREIGAHALSIFCVGHKLVPPSLALVLTREPLGYTGSSF